MNSQKNNDVGIIMAAINQFLELREQEIGYGRNTSYIDYHIVSLTLRLPEVRRNGESSNS